MNAEGARPSVRARPDGGRSVPRTLRAVRDRRPRTCCIRRCDRTRSRASSPTTGRDFGTSAEFPYVGTTYRLTEHFHYWTKHALINAILQPEEFVEIGEALAREKGIAQGGWVRVASKRGAIVCKAYVTKRISPMIVDGKPTHVIGVPLHWGFTGLALKGYGANTLTPSVGDANTQTPEFKAFLVNVEKVSAPSA